MFNNYLAETINNLVKDPEKINKIKKNNSKLKDNEIDAVRRVFTKQPLISKKLVTDVGVQEYWA